MFLPSFSITQYLCGFCLSNYYYFFSYNLSDVVLYNKSRVIFSIEIPCGEDLETKQLIMVERFEVNSETPLLSFERTAVHIFTQITKYIEVFIVKNLENIFKTMCTLNFHLKLLLLLLFIGKRRRLQRIPITYYYLLIYDRTNITV